MMWKLELGNEEIATFVQLSVDFPWTYAKVVESPKFERFREYFTDDENWPETLEFEALCTEIRTKGRFILRNASTNETFRNVRLNQEGGDVVWFRFS